MGKQKSYSEKLKDPRWQKKRLEILERDEWKCQNCYTEDKTLVIHHLKYNNRDPWEIEDIYLISLCEECHLREHSHRKDAEQLLIDELKRGWTLNEITCLSRNLGNLTEKAINKGKILIIQTELADNPERIEELMDEFGY